MRKSASLVAILVAVGLVITACGSSGSTEPVASEPIAAAQATFNDADVTFAQGMIPHHSQAVDMATLALQQSTNPAILDLAKRIQGAQDPEIVQMRGWLATWGQPEMESTMEGMDHGPVEGMMDDAEMAALTTATGAEFDALFVDMMIRHHQGAIAMAKTLLADGSDPAVKALGQAVIAAQEGEITEMQGLQIG